MGKSRRGTPSPWGLQAHPRRAMGAHLGPPHRGVQMAAAATSGVLESDRTSLSVAVATCRCHSEHGTSRLWAATSGPSRLARTSRLSEAAKGRFSETSLDRSLAQVGQESPVAVVLESRHSDQVVATVDVRWRQRSQLAVVGHKRKFIEVRFAVARLRRHRRL